MSSVGLKGRCNVDNQSSQREYLEISDIPDSTGNNELEQSLKKVFTKITVLVDPSLGEDCRRITSPNTFGWIFVPFVNRLL